MLTSPGKVQKFVLRERFLAQQANAPGIAAATPSDARYALLRKVDADLMARHSEPAALANPLARGRNKAPSKIGRGP